MAPCSLVQADNISEVGTDHAEYENLKWSTSMTLQGANTQEGCLLHTCHCENLKSHFGLKPSVSTDTKAITVF
jgi:hypothetical protein